MRVLLGLAALAASVSAQTVTVLQTAGTQYGSMAPAKGSNPELIIALSQVRVRSSTATGAVLTATDPTVISAWGTVSNGGSISISVASGVTSVVFEFLTNVNTGQAAYRWSPNYSVSNAIALNANAYAGFGFGDGTTTNLCDPCTLSAGVWQGDPTLCAPNGPGTALPGTGASSPSGGYQCANLSRFYQMSGLLPVPTYNRFVFTLWSISPSPLPNAYAFTIAQQLPVKIVGDPQIVGMQGQDFQVHGIPDEVFNMVSYPTLQINARFSYLESAECFDNYTACFAHPGTYISEEGFRVGKDKIRITAGSHKKGLSVSVNGKKVNRNTDLKLGAVEIVNHRRVVVHTNIMKVSVTNSDKFLNQELELNDDKLISLGSKRRHMKDNEKFHSEVPLHGLQGQTWRNVEYASGLDYEGSITDYHVVDGNLFGTDFVFNQFEA